MLLKAGLKWDIPKIYNIDFDNGGDACEKR